MARARVCVSEKLDGLLQSDWVKVIENTPFGKDDRKIAEMYLLDWTPQIDIAIELNVDRSTISRRMPYILNKIEKTAHKMGIL